MKGIIIIMQIRLRELCVFRAKLAAISCTPDAERRDCLKNVRTFKDYTRANRRARVSIHSGAHRSYKYKAATLSVSTYPIVQ